MDSYVAIDLSLFSPFVISPVLFHRSTRSKTDPARKLWVNIAVKNACINLTILRHSLLFQILQAYRSYISDMVQLLGVTSIGAKELSTNLFHYEIRLAEITPGPDELNDVNGYMKVTLSNATQSAPSVSAINDKLLLSQTIKLLVLQNNDLTLVGSMYHDDPKYPVKDQNTQQLPLMKLLLSQTFFYFFHSGFFNFFCGFYSKSGVVLKMRV